MRVKKPSIHIVADLFLFFIAFIAYLMLAGVWLVWRTSAWSSTHLNPSTPHPPMLPLPIVLPLPVATNLLWEKGRHAVLPDCFKCQKKHGQHTPASLQTVPWTYPCMPETWRAPHAPYICCGRVGDILGRPPTWGSQPPHIYHEEGLVIQGNDFSCVSGDPGCHCLMPPCPKAMVCQLTSSLVACLLLSLLPRTGGLRPRWHTLNALKYGCLLHCIFEMCLIPS